MKNLDPNLKKMGNYASVAFVAIGLVLIVLELFIHRHGETEIEDLLFFPAFYGFVAFIIIVIVGIGLRKIVMREEDYYD